MSGNDGFPENRESPVNSKNWPTGFIRRREAGARFETCLLGIPRKEVVAGARYANYLKVDLV